MNFFLFAGLFPAPFNRFRVLLPVAASGDAPSLGGMSALPPASSPSLAVMDIRLLSPRHSSLVLTAALHWGSPGFFDRRFSQLHRSTAGLKKIDSSFEALIQYATWFVEKMALCERFFIIGFRCRRIPSYHLVFSGGSKLRLGLMRVH
ncbi:hypothetical protein F2Q69_00038066 [Brassica cretica]|uniref:Uncharacterized protein n=1 Tax=Brassica cretica TaxID=69181 RepID=A0A8S9SCQ2_BRACR|nr:hypothetical protein F2Q69_00038066 [Brassica cretica]